MYSYYYLSDLFMNLSIAFKWTSRKCLSSVFYWPGIINSLQIAPEIVSNSDYNWHHAVFVCNGAGVGMSGGVAEKDKAETVVG